MDRLPVEERTSRRPAAVDWYSIVTRGYRTVMRAQAQLVAVSQAHDGIIGLAKLSGTFNNSLEDRSHIGRRRCDHPEDVFASGLISKCLG